MHSSVITLNNLTRYVTLLHQHKQLTEKVVKFKVISTVKTNVRFN